MPVSTQIYKDVGGMEKSVLDITDILRHQKLGLTVGIQLFTTFGKTDFIKDKGRTPYSRQTIK